MDETKAKNGTKTNRGKAYLFVITKERKYTGNTSIAIRGDFENDRELDYLRLKMSMNFIFFLTSLIIIGNIKTSHMNLSNNY